MSNNTNKSQEKKNFVNSIDPLPRYYFILFLIWKLSLFDLCKGLAFLNNICRKKLRKNLTKFSIKNQVSYISACLSLLFLGSVQMLSEKTNTPILTIFKNNLPIYNINKFSQDWRTFNILNHSNLLQQYPLSDQYKSINILDDAALIQLKSFYQNQQNRAYFGYINLKGSLLNVSDNNFSFFSQARYPLYLKNIKIQTLDSIPKKMEGIVGQRQVISLLFEKDNNIKKINNPSLIKELFVPPVILIEAGKETGQEISDLANKLRLIKEKENDQNLVLENPFKFRKNLIAKNKNINKFFSQIKLKNTISRNYRELFYETELKHVDPNIFNLIEFHNMGSIDSIDSIDLIDLIESIPNQIIEQEINYFDILNLIDKKELVFFNKMVKPRRLSGYWFPDFKKEKKFTFDCFKPSKILVKLPGKYKLFFIKSFSKIVRKQKDFLQSNNLQDNILYLKFQNPFSIIEKNKTHKTYKNQFSTYINTQNKFKKIIVRIKNNRVIIYSKTPRNILGFKIYQFYEARETIKTYSWLIITRAGVSFLGFKLFQRIYQDYGKEIVLSLVNFISLIGILPDSEWLIDDLNLNIYGRSYRGVWRVKKFLNQAAGITPLMAHFSEILWQLRSKNTKWARIFNIFNYSVSQNRSFALQPTLLIGAPGTGKTLLVQALAGETKVPVLLQSGSVLKDFRQRGKGAKSIQNIFRRARQIKPCIIFIDEIDGVGVRRESFSLNVMGEQDIIDNLSKAGSTPVSFEDLEKFQPKTDLKDLFELEEILELDEVVNFGETLTDAAQKSLTRTRVLQEEQVKLNSRTEQLSILIQLLVELDGLHPLNNIMVFGATNRPYVLDPALLRPGRFYKIIQLKLPDQRKRIQILKLYTSYMKQTSSIPWYYFSQRMEGLNAADISAIVNESALISIDNEQAHSLKSLEEAFDRITSYSATKNFTNFKRQLYSAHIDARSRWLSNKFFNKKYRFIKKTKLPTYNFLTKLNYNNYIYLKQYKSIAYYQAGKAITQIVLPNHPSSVYFALQERAKNFRYIAMHGLVLSLMDSLKFRVELEERLVGMLAGKASEFLSGYASILPHLKNFLNHSIFDISSTGGEDVQSATLLSFLMADKWFFYAKRTCTQNYHPILDNFNIHELYQEEISLFKAVLEDIESEMDTENRLVSILKSQKWSYRSWWQKQIADEESFFDRSVMDWYRIYLPETEESERNIEWVPPDDYYTGLNIRMTNLLIYWHHLLKLVYDHLYHSLLINSFNFSFSILNKNRELLDYFTDFVLRHERVRNHQIQILISPFMNKTLNPDIFSINEKTLNRKKIVVFKGWGALSKRKAARVLNVDKMSSEFNVEDGLKDKILKSFQKLEIPEYFIKHRYK